MSLITDKVFYHALLANANLMNIVEGRIENTALPVPDEDALNEPVPYIIISYDGMQNEGFTKDNNFEGDTDKVQVSILAAAESREALGDIMTSIRQTVISYFDDPDGEDAAIVPANYTLSASEVEYDPEKPCYWQALQYNCDTNP